MDDNRSLLTEAIWQTLAYADLFDYPLKIDEIHRYLTGIPAQISAVEDALKQEGDLFIRTGDFYTLAGRTGLVALRKKRNQIAARLWRSAAFYGRLIARLPFVRMTAVTGGLAVNNVENGADIDYLIVTEPGHLWLTRAQVVLLGRISALHRAILCPNYLVTLRSLTFPDQNPYSAHELAQMVPLSGLDIYQQIRSQNTWALKFLPNAAGAPNSAYLAVETEPRSLTHAAIEELLEGSLLTRLEQWEMNRKIRRLRREQHAAAESIFSADVCKGHNLRHQFKTLTALEKPARLLESS